jgi:hypothetical protein
MRERGRGEQVFVEVEAAPLVWPEVEAAVRCAWWWIISAAGG